MKCWFLTIITLFVVSFAIAGDPDYDPSQDDPLLHADVVLRGRVVSNTTLKTRISEWCIGGPELEAVQHEVLSVWIEVAEVLRGDIDSTRIEVFFWNLVFDYCRPGDELIVAADITPVNGRLLVGETRGLIVPRDGGWLQVGAARTWSDVALRSTIEKRVYSGPSN